MASLPARYHDGRIARTHEVSVRMEPSGLTITDPAGGLIDRWPAETLVLVERTGRDDPTVLGSSARQDARLSFADAAARPLLLQAIPGLPSDGRADRRMAIRVAAWGLGAAAAVAIIVLVLIPRLAPQAAALIPLSIEESLGARVSDQVAWLLAEVEGRETSDIDCRGRGGLAALDVIESRLVRALDADRDFAIRLVDADLVNAFALPGGHIIVTSGMIDFARSPEALAGVLAHEIGHAVLRHPMEGLMRDTATSLVVGLAVGDFMGGAVVASLGERLLVAGYSRKAEEAADEFAIGLLQRAGIDPLPSARLFARLAARETDAGPLDLFATHPAPSDRAARLRAAAGGATTRSVLPAHSWRALRRACN